MIWALRDTWTITRRDLIQWFTQPWRIVGELLFPIMFVLLFGYVFGSGMVVPGGGDYREFLMPGLFVMTMAFGIGNTMTVVATDVERGVMDRFRSMPISPAAVVAGRCWADMLNSAAGLAITIACGLVVGWAWHDGLPSAALAVALLLVLRFACLWIGIWLGLIVGSPEAAGSVWGLLFPLTMITSAFVAPVADAGLAGRDRRMEPVVLDRHRHARAVRQRGRGRRLLDRPPCGADGRGVAGGDLGRVLPALGPALPAALAVAAEPFSLRGNQVVFEAGGVRAAPTDDSRAWPWLPDGCVAELSDSGSAQTHPTRSPQRWAYQPPPIRSRKTTRSRPSPVTTSQ